MLYGDTVLDPNLTLIRVDPALEMVPGQLGITGLRRAQ